MTMPTRALLVTSFLCICSLHAVAQLATPVIDTAGVNWGWFTLRMTGATGTPHATRWTIMSEYGDTLLDKSCANCAGSGEACPGDMYGDVCDLTEKFILGCAPDSAYVATVQYNDGTTWSPRSNAIHFSTPPEPAWSGDTTYVVLWGHSFVAYGPDCSVKNTIRLAGDWENPYDNFGKAIQTRLRAQFKRPITVINRGIAGSTQFDWIHSNTDPVSGEYKYGPDSLVYQHFDTCYGPGGSYVDHVKYPVAVFFIGDNDAVAQYPDSLYAKDLRKILTTLTRVGVRVVYNSIHYTTSPDYSSPDRELAYFNAWDAEMTSLSHNANIWRGYDYYHAFQAEPQCMLGTDGIHPDFSEALATIADAVTPIIAQALSGQHTPVRNAASVMQPTLNDRFPNPAHECVNVILGASDVHTVRVHVIDMLGRETHPAWTITNNGGGNVVQIDANGLSRGVYQCRIEGAGSTLTSRFVVQR